MAPAQLAPDERTQIITLLEPSLRAEYDERGALHLSPSQLDGESEPERLVVVEGSIGFYREQKAFKGTVIVPVMVGKVMLPMQMPLVERYWLYDLTDDEQRRAMTLVATARDADEPAPGRARFGGVLKRMRLDDESVERLFLEVIYLT
jgi:hypothetical protein